MSNRRPPKARQDQGQTGSGQGKDSNVSTADRQERPDRDDRSDAPADAATLGFADLAERAPAAELAAFRDLRARLFGDIDVSEPAFPETEREEDPSDHAAVPAPFVPEQVSIAHGALTAAEIAAADGDLDDEPELEDVDEPEVEVDDQAAGLSDDMDIEAPEAAVEVVPEVAAPTPAVVAPASATAAEPVPTSSQDWAFGGTTTAPDVTESEHRRAPLIAIAAALAVAALVAGWFALSSGDSTDEATPTPANEPRTSQSSTVQTSSTSEVDGESVRTSQQLVFDETVSQITLAVPQRPAASAAADFDVEISELTISIPGQPTQRVTEAVDSATGSITVDLDQPSTRVTVSYTAQGAVIQTEPSSAHRAIVLVTPIQVAAADGSTGLVTVKGSDVLNLGCAAGDQGMRACGQQTEEGWEVAVPTLGTDVIAQVDLPE